MGGPDKAAEGGRVSIFALIGARSGSVGVPGKNIRRLAGHPLLAYSIKAAHKAGIRDVIVSTDSAEYSDIAHSYGALTPFLRPAHISGPDSTDYEFIAHAIETLEYLRGTIVLLRPTTPLRDPKVIADAVAMTDTFPTGAMRSVHEMPESAYKCFEVNAGVLVPLGTKGLPDPNNPRQHFPKTYTANGYVDIFFTDFIQSHRALHGGLLMPYVTPRVTEIDTEGDWDYIEWQAAKNPALIAELFS
jgi:CMP-N-acetylneuraminic acid synthetase